MEVEFANTKESDKRGICVGIIGAGVAATYHVAALKSVPHVSIYIYDIDYERAYSLAKAYDCIHISHLNELYEVADALIIATPPDSHYKIFMEAIQRKKHILCEKPMTENLNEADEMYKKSKNMGYVYAMGFNYRYFYITDIFKSRLRISNINHIEIVIKRLFRRGSFGEGDSVLSDLGAHLIDYVMYLTNSSINLDVCNVNMKKMKNVDYSTVVEGSTCNGITFNISMSRIECEADVCFRLDIISEKEHLKYDSRDRMNYVIESADVTNRHAIGQVIFTNDFFDFSDSIREQDKEWLQLIQGVPARKLASMNDGIMVQRALNDFLKRICNE